MAWTGQLVSLQAKLRVPGGVHRVFCGCFLGTVQNSAVFQHFLLASGISVPNFGSVSLLGRLQSQLNALFLPAISKCWGFPGQEPAETEPAQPGMLRVILGWVRLSQTLSLFLSQFWLSRSLSPFLSLSRLCRFLPRLFRSLSPSPLSPLAAGRTLCR